MSITVKTATASDAHDYATVLCNSWMSAYKGLIPDEALKRNTDIPKREKSLAEWMKSDCAVYLIAYDDATPCGICSISQSRDEDTFEHGEIVAIYTICEYWGKGVGTILMKKALQALAKQGYKKAVLWVLEDNTRARRFYEKSGFVFDGTFKCSGLGNANEIRYITDINNAN